MLAVHRPLPAGGRSSNGGSVASVLGGQVKRKRSALNAVANAHGHSSRSHLSTMENRERISLDPGVWKYDSSWNSCKHEPQSLKSGAQMRLR